MDGASPATPDVEAGRDFTYRFSVPLPGTYWAHPHTGLDADYGLYLPVIVDDPAEPADYDVEWIVVLDDWTDGIGSSPTQIYEELRRSSMPGHRMPGMGDMPGMTGVGNSDLLGGDAGDVNYPYYLVNGRIATAPITCVGSIDDFRLYRRPSCHADDEHISRTGEGWYGTGRASRGDEAGTGRHRVAVSRFRVHCTDLCKLVD
jgi:hypothetical protein